MLHDISMIFAYYLHIYHYLSAIKMIFFFLFFSNIHVQKCKSCRINDEFSKTHFKSWTAWGLWSLFFPSLPLASLRLLKSYKRHLAAVVTNPCQLLCTMKDIVEVKCILHIMKDFNPATPGPPRKESTFIELTEVNPSNIRHEDFPPLFRLCLFVTLRVPPLDPETGWTGDSSGQRLILLSWG